MTLKQRVMAALKEKLWHEFSKDGEVFREELIEQAAVAAIDEVKSFLGDSE